MLWMTRPQFEKLYLDLFYNLVQSMERRGYDDGADAIQTVYCLAIRSGCYRNRGRGKKQNAAWLTRKVWKQVRKQRQEQHEQFGSRRITEED